MYNLVYWIIVDGNTSNGRFISRKSAFFRFSSPSFASFYLKKPIFTILLAFSNIVLIKTLKIRDFLILCRIYCLVHKDCRQDLILDLKSSERHLLSPAKCPQISKTFVSKILNIFEVFPTFHNHFGKL